MDTLKRIEKIIRESAFDKKKKKPGLKFNPWLALTCVRTTGPRRVVQRRESPDFRSPEAGISGEEVDLTIGFMVLCK